MPKIYFKSLKFPSALNLVSTGICSCTWSRIIWAATTVGKASRKDANKFGKYSVFEHQYREAIIYANLKEDSAGILHRSESYDALDPSEKAAISYFLGLSMAKFFAARYLGVSWLMHLDLYKVALGIQIKKGRSRPDLIGLNKNKEWIAMEAKGSSNKLRDKVIKKAKQQASRIPAIKGETPILKVALACYFDGTQFKVHWEDPKHSDKSLVLESSLYTEENEYIGIFLGTYYKPLLDLFEARSSEIRERHWRQDTFDTLYLPGLDTTIGLSKRVQRSLEDNDYQQILYYDSELDEDFIDVNTPRVGTHNLTIGGDGVMIELGNAWDIGNMLLEPAERQ